MTRLSVVWTRRVAVAAVAAGLAAAAVRGIAADAPSPAVRFAGEFRCSQTFVYVAESGGFFSPTKFPYVVDWALRVADDGTVEGTGSGVLSFDFKGEHHEARVSATIGGKLRRRGGMARGTLVGSVRGGPGLDPSVHQDMFHRVRVVRTSAGDLVVVDAYARLVGLWTARDGGEPPPPPVRRSTHPHSGEYTFTSRFDYPERVATDPPTFTSIPVDIAWRAYVLPDGALVGAGAGRLPNGTEIAGQLQGDVRRSRRADGVFVRFQQLAVQAPYGAVYSFDFRDRVRAERNGDLTLVRRGNGAVEQQTWTLVGPLR